MEQGFKRLSFFFFISIMFIHIITCLFVIIPQIYVTDGNFENTWIAQFYDEGMAPTELYAVSMYWTVTTITTVGYGDIQAKNPIEMVFCSMIMLVGVISFSYANGSLASILTSHDNDNAVLHEKLTILDKIKKMY